ncbi:S1 family peptidase [Streptomyces sp. NPDC059853]|uniref:S1 family peptidase n=1 Tax=Streptomyces sp. NPDC059853 TaxID=3346973 RepID=UPI00364ABC9E
MRLSRYGSALFALLTTALLLGAAAPAAATATTVRGGDRVYSAAATCVVAFNARDGGAQRYGLLPGGCGGPGTTWYADPGLTVPVGTTSASSFPGGGWSLLRYAPTVTAPGEISGGGVPQPIVSAAPPAVGGRVCLAGPTTGLRCGTVTAVNQTINVGGAVYTGVFRTDLCVEPGTGPGAPAFSGSTGLGMLIGGSGNCATGGVSYYLPLVQALSAFGLTLA